MYLFLYRKEVILSVSVV